jgi:hypothetical protein
VITKKGSFGSPFFVPEPSILQANCPKSSSRIYGNSDCRKRTPETETSLLLNASWEIASPGPVEAEIAIHGQRLFRL